MENQNDENFQILEMLIDSKTCNVSMAEISLVGGCLKSVIFPQDIGGHLTFLVGLLHFHKG
jgi:hypothetical protein